LLLTGCEQFEPIQFLQLLGATFALYVVVRGAFEEDKVLKLTYTIAAAVLFLALTLLVVGEEIADKLIVIGGTP
jgi:multisubunit Na+/H+ antiporter MnhF subunit